jgi:hypothetical protein
VKAGRTGRRCNRTLADFIFPQAGYFLGERNMDLIIVLVESSTLEFLTTLCID